MASPEMTTLPCRRQRNGEVVECAFTWSFAPLRLARPKAAGFQLMPQSGLKTVHRDSGPETVSDLRTAQRGDWLQVGAYDPATVS